MGAHLSQVGVNGYDDSNLDKDIDNNALNDNDKITAFDIEDPDLECSSCKARMWSDEQLAKTNKYRQPKFVLCCMEKKVELPQLRHPPPELAQLHSGKDIISQHFLKNIRSFNAMFNFTSMARKVDHQINRGTTLPVFKLGGENYHLIGSLLPPKNSEISYSKSNKDLYEAVQTYMVYGSYGLYNVNSPCMTHGHCTKMFPKEFRQRTIIDEVGFPKYRKRDDVRTMQKKEVHLDNSYTVPYNGKLLLRYFLAEIKGPEQKSDSETEKDCRCCWILTSLHSKWIFWSYRSPIGALSMALETRIDGGIQENPEGLNLVCGILSRIQGLNDCDELQTPEGWALPWKEPCVLEEEDSRKAEIQKIEHLQNLNLFSITAKQSYKITIACFKPTISVGSTLTQKSTTQSNNTFINSAPKFILKCSTPGQTQARQTRKAQANQNKFKPKQSIQMHIMHACPMADEAHLSVIQPTRQVLIVLRLSSDVHPQESMHNFFSNNQYYSMGVTFPGIYIVPGHTYVAGSTEYRVFNLAHVVASHGT
ncbi:hypothetical protein AHAS_Ahas04G0080000 [Arachis hypogaea]